MNFIFTLAQQDPTGLSGSQDWTVAWIVGLLLFFLLAMDVFANYRVRIGTPEVA